MKIQEHIEQAYQKLLDTTTKTRVTLLHPQSKYRSLLLAKLLQEPNSTIFYYAMGSDDIHLKAFLNNLSHRFANQHPTFGRRINMLPYEVHDAPEKNLDLLLKTFVQEIREISDGQMALIVFDEYDCSDEADDIHRFVEELVDVLPENARVIINSRTLPRLPWVAMVARQQAALLRDDTLVQDNFYETNSDGSMRLQVYALGPGRVLLDDNLIDTWEGHLPRLLFFFALDRHIVTRSAICHAFWPDLEIDQAVNVFHVTKRRLHKALNLDVLVHHETHYQINPDLNVYYDVVEFVETLMKGRDENNPNRMDAWQQAVKLYKGPFLQGHNEPWIEKRRAAFSVGFVEALSNMAEVHEADDRKEQALKLYIQAINEDPTREDLHRRVMGLYAQMGRRGEALVHYQQLERVMRERSRPLTPETMALHQEIVSQ